MNLSSMPSLYLRDVCVSKDCEEEQPKMLNSTLTRVIPVRDEDFLNSSPYLSKGEDTFFSPNNAAFHHDKVIIHFTIARKASL